MDLRRFLAEAGALVALAVACALVSNALAGKERHLPVPGDYPNATRVTTGEARPRLAPFDAEGSPLPAGGTTEAAPPASPRSTEDTPARPVAPAAAPTPVKASSVSAPASSAPAPSGATNAAEVLRRFPAHGQPYAEITGEAAAWLHGRGVVFLDARRSKDFDEGHIRGARSFPVWEAEVVRERVEAFLAEGHDRAAPLVAYCSGGDCEDSHMLAQTLFGAGFENVLVYRDGFPDWRARGGATSTGGGR